MVEAQKWVLIFAVASCIALLVLLQPILTPFILGALLAYLCDPVVERLQRWHVQRTMAVAIVMILMLLMVLLSILILIPILQRQAMILINTIPDILAWINDKALPTLISYTGLEMNNSLRLDIESLQTLMVGHWQQAGDWATNVFSTVSRSGATLAMWIVNLLLIPVVMFYLLRDWNVILKRIHALLPRRIEGIAIQLAHQCDDMLGSFIRGQLLVMLCLAGLYSIGLWLVGIKMAVLIGMMAGVLSVVPYLGFAVGLTSALLVALVQFHAFLPLALVALVFVICQFLDGMFLTPVMVGDRIGLHPVAVIFSVLAGGQLFGFLGVLLALPVAAISMVLLRYAYGRYRESLLYTQTLPVTTDKEKSA